MKDKPTDKASSQPVPESVTPGESKKRLAMLKTEVAFDFPGLLERLESGDKVFLVSHTDLEGNFDPDWLRRLGGMTLLCHRYGAAVIFVNNEHVVKVGNAHS